jgi:hypothetical protein
VDHIGGLINHHRREPGEWTVSSELSLELAPDALTQINSAPELPVIGTGRPCGRKGPNGRVHMVVATLSILRGCGGHVVFGGLCSIRGSVSKAG